MTDENAPESSGTTDAPAPPHDMEYGTVAGGFSCANCTFFAPNENQCHFERASKPQPFTVDPAGCCRFFENPSYKGDRPGIIRIESRAGFEARTGIAPPHADGRVPAHKPTERHLNAIIKEYRSQYVDAGNEAVQAVVAYVRENGKRSNMAEARGIFLRHIGSIREYLRPHVEMAVRLGASRVDAFAKNPKRADELAASIIPPIEDARARWLAKMAGDFVQRVYAPALKLPTARAVALQAADGDPVSPDDFSFGPIDDTFVFDEELLADLETRGYTFVKVRAVEATEHDVWKGDDLGFLRAAQQEGEQQFVWNVSPDDRVCPICSDLDGETFTGSEAERISADRGIVAHCRCRCWFDTAAES